MPYAIELFLDERADNQIRQIWAALDERGVTSLGGVPDTEYQPHVSLSVFDGGEPDAVAEALRPLFTESLPLPVVLSPLGFFLTPEAVAFLGAIPSARLLALHRAVHDAIEPLVSGVWPRYRPDALLPHCTLAVGVTDRTRLIDVVSRFRTPVYAVVAEACLVEVPGGRSTVSLTSEPEDPE